MAKFRKKNNLLSAWQYVLLDILYIIPVIGIIVALIHTFDTSNENRQHYARAFFLRLLIFISLLGIGAVALYLYLGNSGFLTLVDNLCNAFTRSFHNFVGLF